MSVQLEREMLEQMSLYPPAANQSAAATRPAPVRQFTEEELLEAAEKNWMVRANIMVPHTGAVRKAATMTNRERRMGRG
jgi:tRNA A58 N-methylase Trm61